MPRDPRTISNTPREEIERIMRENEIAKAWKDSKKRVVQCPVCESVFVEQRPWQKFCHSRCRAVWFNIKRRIEKEMAGTSPATSYKDMED